MRSAVKKAADYTLEERQALCASQNVTLNGHRAKVSGYALEFPTVTALTGPAKGASYEFAWATVDLVIRHKKGNFFA